MKEETRELSRIEEAIMTLADYLEDVNHADYAVKKHIMEILEIELKPKVKND